MDAVPSGPVATPPTPGFIDFLVGSDSLEIVDDGVSLYSVGRPGGFDAAQRFEIGVYPNGGAPTLLVDEVSYTPEPASAAMLGFGAVALLVRRRRS